MLEIIKKKAKLKKSRNAYEFKVKNAPNPEYII